jgi:hypothetical protein
MNPDDVIYPPTYRKSPVGVLLLVLLFSSPLLLAGRLTVTDQIWYGSILLLGTWFVGRAFWARRFYEKIYYEGRDLEARILSPFHEDWKMAGAPQAFGVFYRPLKVQYELNGETVISQQDVSDAVRARLSGRQTVDIRVHPEKPRAWVLMPF